MVALFLKVSHPPFSYGLEGARLPNSLLVPLPHLLLIIGLPLSDRTTSAPLASLSRLNALTSRFIA